MTKPRHSETEISLLNVSGQNSTILDSYISIKRHHNTKQSSIVPYKPADSTISFTNKNNKVIMEDSTPADKKRKIVFRTMVPRVLGC